ncbi:4Fe-4S dicluster domain-containing protein [Thiorhodococcus mannitoliphagus]|uniref:4Fe-4S dicluster domain-containing protein n=1 Tax=Thiorhodococcus mannitoliphagus TaxID=329406 RepID=A0A6P1DTW3_9GAMM|nr:4Fe-4S dicluster domain-containing protein [Thiorhodococcus mannitoliphagus]NEX20401.1 4Fe-4S dicluster domain-containing protein [Thiorhodococcus mannitoliphagus]
MGHLAGGKSGLTPLIDRLNRYPIGLVDSERLREILSLLFDEMESFVGSRFPLHEATLEELARLTEMSPEQVLPVLERMADKGLVMDMPFAGTTYYLLVPGLIGFMEFTFMRRHSDLPLGDLARLMSEYLEEQGKAGQAGEFFGSRTQLTRALVYDTHIPVSSQVTSYEDARQIIQDADYCAVTLCYCRHKKEHLGETCRKGAPVEDICMVLGEGARFLVRRGFAQERDKASMLETLEHARALGLTHVTDNVREQPSFLCNCCRCCCELMAGVQLGFSDGIAKTPFLAEIDPQGCNYCGACLKACNVKCIGLDPAARHSSSAARFAAIDASVCLGCGACVSVCEQGAITLSARAQRRKPPKARGQLFARILWEKGRLWPFVLDRARRWLP